MEQSRFKDRTQAGKQLAARLGAYARRADAIVLGLTRGGVPVGFAVASALQIAFDVLLVRKLGAPGQKELAIGAVANGGLRVMNQDLVAALGITPQEIETVVRHELLEIERREDLYRTGRPAPQLPGSVVILVDDGVATGATMLAAVRLVRQHEPARVIVAVPVAPPAACAELRGEADEMICLQTPEPFQSVGAWYEDFPQISDTEVIELLRQSEQWPALRIDARGYGPAHPKTA